MKKTSLGLFVILFAMMAAVLCTSCKKEEPVEPTKFDLKTVDFIKQKWTLSHCYCVELRDNQYFDQMVGADGNTYDQVFISFQSDKTMEVYVESQLIENVEIVWNTSTKALKAVFQEDIFDGTVKLMEDDTKVYFKYAGKSSRLAKDFTMEGYKLKKDFK